MWRNGYALTVLSALVVFLFCSGAHAQRTVPGIEIMMDDWTFIPTLYNGQVESFVALRTDLQNVRGSNVTAMWFTHNGDGTWSEWGWEEQNQAKTVGYVKAILNISSDEDDKWRIAPEAVDPNDVPATRMSNGVFENDPFADAVASATDPQEVLAFLELIGWAAADNTITSTRCEKRQSLDLFSAAVTAEIAEEGAAAAVLANQGSPICQVWGSTGGTGCTPSTVTGPVFSSGCVFLGWTFVGTTTSGTSPQGCWIDNEWLGTHFYYERRKITRTYANCSTCTVTQTRTKNCTDTLVSTDFALGFQTPCAIPTGYAPPAPAAGASSCYSATETCGGWTDWAPPEPGASGSPCP